jgi:hypothetical protein
VWPLQPSAHLAHLICTTDAAPTRRAREEEKTMEIAAFVMFVTAIVGIVQQFDEARW